MYGANYFGLAYFGQGYGVVLRFPLNFVYDSFTENSGTPNLSAHVGEAGAVWTKHGSSGSGTVVVPSAIKRARVGTTGGNIIYYASGVPPSADYAVEAVFYIASILSTIGIAGRMSTSANTYYALQYQTLLARWDLLAVVAGAVAFIGAFSQTLTPGNSYTARLEMQGSRIKAYIDGVEQISVVDSNIADAGRAGIRVVNTASDSTGYHLDSITALPIYADTLILSDSSTVSLTLSRSDTITLTDADAETVRPLPADTITLSDSLSRVWTAYLDSADSITITDALAAAPSVPRGDVITLSDTAVLQVQPGRSDTITLSDALAKVESLSRTDTITLNDLRSTDDHLYATDTIILNDSLTAAVTALRSTSDVITLSDGSSWRLTRYSVQVTRDAIAMSLFPRSSVAFAPLQSSAPSLGTQPRSRITMGAP